MNRERKELFRKELIELVNKHIRENEIKQDEVATVFSEEANEAISYFSYSWKPHYQRAAYEHFVAAAACLNGRVIPVPGFDILFPELEGTH